MYTNIGLYYPFIHFKDDAWLKLSALYWDKMGRIVPAAYGSPNDSDTVKQLDYELGFIKNYDPENEAYEVGTKFIELITTHSKELRIRYDLSNRSMWPDDTITQKMAPKGSDPKLAYIFSSKLYKELTKALAEANLSSVNRLGDERWIGMHPKLAGVYMTALAGHLAGNAGCRPVTDETTSHTAVNSFTLERLAQALLDDVAIVSTKPTSNEVERLLVRFTLQMVIPQDIEALPVKNIIKVRKDYPGELANFQQYIHQLVTELEQLNIKDIKYLPQHLEVLYDKEIKPKLDDLKERLKSAGIKSVAGAMGISMSSSPLLLTILNPLLGLIGSAGAIIANGARIALGLTPVLLDRKKTVHDEMKSSETAYLLGLEQNLVPSTLISRITNDSKKFFSGK